jgi:hypothetical protein
MRQMSSRLLVIKCMYIICYPAYDTYKTGGYTASVSESKATEPASMSVVA